MLFPPFPSIACLSSSSSATLACYAREAAAVVCHACKCYPSSSTIVKWGFFVQVYLLAGQLSKTEYHFSCVQFKCRELLTCITLLCRPSKFAGCLCAALLLTQPEIDAFAPPETNGFAKCKTSNGLMMLPPEAKSTGGLARCAIHASWNTFEGSKFPLSHVDFGFRFIPSPQNHGLQAAPVHDQK